MRGCDQLVQRWRSLLGLTITGGMLLWGRYLEPGSVDWLSGIFTLYWVLCAIVAMASIALFLQETTAAASQLRLEHARRIRRAHQQLSAGRDPIVDMPRSEA